MISQIYRAQVDLLLQVLPYVAKEEIFALKGGTAINLFVREMPRLSVDIDLTYLPFDSRDNALRNIEEALNRIKADIGKNIPEVSVHPVPLHGGTDVKLNCQSRKAQIKIEVNTITRGNIFPTELMQVVDSVQDEFGKFAAINVVSLAELYGGKICAALDRQHPRDFFDVKLLLENEGLTNNIWEGFKIGLISHYKPVNELLTPILKDQKPAFEKQFAGMTLEPFTYDDYVSTRKTIVDSIRQRLTDDDKKFLLSFETGIPKWDLFPYELIKELPAVKWKLLNIQKLREMNPKKHETMITNLRNTLKAQFKKQLV
ncbi:MAG: nucleotidyl transferase AbiEii/AbiGii toxin family protein [Bacteroidales bacterium]